VIVAEGEIDLAWLSGAEAVTAGQSWPAV
jgi:hypothetical protein